MLDVRFLITVMLIFLGSSAIRPETKELHRRQRTVANTSTAERVNSTCAVGDFTCSTGACVSQQVVCNHYNDCGDGSDEVACSRTTQKCWAWQTSCSEDGNCQSDYFQCGNGKCISFGLACNNEDNCGDRSDEQRAVPGLKCSYGSRSDVCVLPQRYVNDSTKHCKEEIDSCYNDRGEFACFECFDRRLLIGNMQICDGVIDCFDLSDECACPSDVRPAVCSNLCRSPIQCQMKTFTCGNFTRNITDICNRRIDCPDGEDELYCRKLASSSLISCPGNKKNTTTLTAFKCDGRPECYDLSDECRAGCPHEAPFCKLMKGSNNDDILSISCQTPNNETYNLTVVDICDGTWSPCVPRIPEEEANCSARLDCQSGNFISIDRSLACNGYRDCDDGADEINCPGRFHCETSVAPVSVPQSFMFDDYWDCHDGSDECPSVALSNSSFASETEMIHNTFLKVWLWIMALIALTGNTFVFIETFHLLRDGENESQVSKTNHFLIFNLALADFLMGVYLLAMAIKSAQYSGKYCFFDKLWRTSSTCHYFGALSVISCEASVMVLSLMTGIRCYVVTRPIASKTMNFRYVIVATLMVWLIAIALAVMPLSAAFTDEVTSSVWIPSKFEYTSRVSLRPAISLCNTIGIFSPGSVPLITYSSETSWNVVSDFLDQNGFGNVVRGLFGYYSLNSMCVPEWFVTSKTLGWQFSIVVVSINFIMFLFVVGCYLAIYLKSTSCAEILMTTQAAHRSSCLQAKIVKLVVTDFVCWVPTIIMVFIHFSEVVVLGRIFYVITAVILLPINSVLNPLLYSDCFEYMWNAGKRGYQTIRKKLYDLIASEPFSFVELREKQENNNVQLKENHPKGNEDTANAQRVKTKC